MVTLPGRVEATLFNRLAPQLIKHIRAVTPADADGLVKEIYRQMEEEFGLVPPVTLHAPIPELLAGVWGMVRESVVAGPVSRAHREIVCESVSAINRCSFCVDAHSVLLEGVDQGGAAQAIRAHRPDQISDPESRAIAEWAFANRRPEAEILRRPPFSVLETPEIIASAVCFHYIDRMVSVFLRDSPVPLPAGLRWLRPTTIRVAGTTVGRRTMSLTIDPGRGVGSIPVAKPSPEFGWASSKPVLAEAFGSLEALIGELGRSALEPTVRELVKQRVALWRGEDPGMSRGWVEEAVHAVDGKHRAATRLCLLVAIAPHQVDEEVIGAFRLAQPDDTDLLAASAWASFAATRQVSSWLAPLS